MQPLFRPTIGEICTLITSALRNRNRIDPNTHPLSPWIGKDIHLSIHLSARIQHPHDINPSVYQCDTFSPLSISMLMSNVDSFLWHATFNAFLTPCIHLILRPSIYQSIHFINHLPFRPTPPCVVLVIPLSRQLPHGWIVTSFPRHRLHCFALAVQVIAHLLVLYSCFAIPFCFSPRSRCFLASCF